MIVYSRPPYPDMDYPYIIVNIFDETSFRYINPNSAKSVIIDSGVHSVFHRLELNEYPGGYQAWIAKAVKWWNFVKKMVNDVYVVIPDYPSDYKNNPISDNIERTIRNIEYATSRYPDVNWIIPIQGKKNDVISVIKTFEYVATMGVLDKYDYIAIAPTCTTHSVKFLYDVAVLIWKRIKQIEKNNRHIKIHMFGTNMKSWRYLASFIDSTDTIVTNYLCLPLIGKMCTTRKEKEKAWQMFLRRAEEVASVKRL
jgi:hypothetical protein